jgi:hypothetical protein
MHEPYLFSFDVCIPIELLSSLTSDSSLCAKSNTICKSSLSLQLFVGVSFVRRPVDSIYFFFYIFSLATWTISCSVCRVRQMRNRSVFLHVFASILKLLLNFLEVLNSSFAHTVFCSANQTSYHLCVCRPKATELNEITSFGL